MNGASEAATVIAALLAPMVVGSKRARTLQLWPVFSTVELSQSDESPVRCSNWPASVPPSVTPVTLTASAPVLVTVDSCVAAGPSSTSSEPNARAVGLCVAYGAAQLIFTEGLPVPCVSVAFASTE